MKTKNIIEFLSVLLILSSCGNQAKFIAPKEVRISTDSLALRYDDSAGTDWLKVGLWGIPLPVDYDGDGRMDLLISCPDTPYKGLYLFRNIGTSSKPFFDKARRVSAVGKNNIRLSEVNGEPRVLSPGREYPGFIHAPYDSVARIRYSGEKLGVDYKKSRSNMWNLVDFDGDGDLDIIVGIDTWDDYGWDNAYDEDGNWMNGPLHGYVYLLENCDGKYVNRGKLSAGGDIIDVYGSPNPCVADFDGDGDLDIICGEFVDGLTHFENIGTREAPEYASGRQLKNDDGEIRFHLQMIVPVPSDFDGDGHCDLIVGDEDGRIAYLRNTGKLLPDGMPVFESPIYFRQKADRVKFGALSTPFAVDFDDDGDFDIMTGNSAGEIALIRNVGTPKQARWAVPEPIRINGEAFRIMAGENGSIQGPAERKWGYTVLNVVDWDNDGILDIVLNSIWGKIQWLKGLKPGELDFAPPQDVEVMWEGATPYPVWNWWKPASGKLVTQWRTTPVVTDWNGDGLADLIVLDTEGYPAFFERFRSDDGELLLKPGKRIFYCINCSLYDNREGVLDSTPGILRLNSGTAGKSGRRKIALADIDGDGLKDLIVDSRSVSWFRNLGTDDGLVRLEFMGDLSDVRFAGHTTCPTIADIDADGIPEIILGAEDGHFYLLENPTR